MTTKHNKTSDPKTAAPTVAAVPASPSEPPADFMIFVQSRRVAALAELFDAIGQHSLSDAVERAVEEGDYKHWADKASQRKFGYTESLIAQAIAPAIWHLRNRELARLAEMTAAAGAAQQ